MFDNFYNAHLVDNEQITNNLPKGRFARCIGFLPGGFNFFDFDLNFTVKNRAAMTAIGVGE
ncbi:MAG TPA: hypothetical protein VGO67_06110 [Verrucomicrobiae bacterium]|jgi:hypothetical protein